jgi:hypothetical protein
MSKILLDRAQKRRDKALADAQAISSKAEAETRELTDEENTSFDAALADAGKAKADIARFEAQAEYTRTAPAVRVGGDGTWPGELPPEQQDRGRVGNAKPAWQNLSPFIF